MQQQEKTARRRLVLLFAERDLESTQPAAVTKRNVVTQRANVPCEYRTSPRRRHASSIGAIGSRADALCSRALWFRKPSEAFREGQLESFLDQSLGFLESASATVGGVQIACNGCVRLTISASGQKQAYATSNDLEW